MQDEFRGKTVLITGGLGGQGWHYAKTFAEAGAKVYLTDNFDRPEDGLSEEALAESNAINFGYFRHDVSKLKDWQDIAAAIAAEEPKLDVLVNCAGITSNKDLLDEDVESFQSILSVNLLGPFLGMQTLATLLEQSEAPSIVNIASIYGKAATRTHAAYQSSKAGLIVLSRHAALALSSKGIRVNSICPGSTAAAMRGQPRGSAVNSTPLKRSGEFRELADAVLFLASERSSYITGTEIVVDGGFLAGQS